MTRHYVLIAVCAAVLSACATLRSGCETGEIRLTQDFANAPGSACTRTGPASFELTVSPESADINPSPWYAFDIITPRPAEVSVTLDYGEYRHRYRPKFRQADGGWITLPDETLTLGDGDNTALLRLDLERGTSRIAAQEVLSPEDRAAWRAAFAEQHGLEREILGASIEGRLIEALLRRSEDPDAPLIVVIGGQHPPEVTGALALRSFLETLFGRDHADEVLSGHEWLIVPDLNPDGIMRGHWRENLGGLDLNRDWGPFTQPETSAVRDAIEARRAAGHTPFLLLDFHSTRRDVLYTPDDAMELSPANFSADWVALLDDSWTGTGAAFERDPGHNPGLPTSKTWFAETYGAPGLTVEFGDETDRDRIEALATAAATALHRYLRDQD